jgi:hypothetical protein
LGRSIHYLYRFAAEGKMLYEMPCYFLIGENALSLGDLPVRRTQLANALDDPAFARALSLALGTSDVGTYIAEMKRLLPVIVQGIAN